MPRHSDLIDHFRRSSARLKADADALESGVFYLFEQTAGARLDISHSWAAEARLHAAELDRIIADHVTRKA